MSLPPFLSRQAAARRHRHRPRPLRPRIPTASAATPRPPRPRGPSAGAADPTPPTNRALWPLDGTARAPQLVKVHVLSANGNQQPGHPAARASGSQRIRQPAQPAARASGTYPGSAATSAAPPEAWTSVATRDTTESTTPRAMFSRGSPTPHEADGLALGKHGARAQDLGGDAGARERRELVVAHARPIGHDLEEAPRARRALVVHREPRDTPAAQANQLRVLAANVDHGAVRAKEPRGPAPVARDLLPAPVAHGLLPAPAPTPRAAITSGMTPPLTGPRPHARTSFPST